MLVLRLRRTWLALALLGFGACAAAPALAQAEASGAKARLLVLTDIEADPDDTQSLIRLLLYANEIDLEGLVATTSVHQKARIAPESIRRVIAEYSRVRDNLALHDPDYPTASSLQRLVANGQPSYGMAAIGPGKDSAGSKRIIAALEAQDARPLWVAGWGGPNTLAQALLTIRATRSPREAKRLIAKLRVYTISDQDDTGPWIRKEFPDLFYVVSPGGYGAATWTGINAVIEGVDNESISNGWLTRHIQQGHGPFGAAYPDVAYGMEGDTPTFLGLIPNGLNVPERPDWGGWGGRYALRLPDHNSLDPKGFTGGVPVPVETRAFWTNAIDTFTPRIARSHGQATGPAGRSFTGFRETLWRWRDDFQNDFAARIGWTTLSVADANHAPIVRLDHADRLTVRSGDAVPLSALGTTDPDGDNLSYYWFQYPEAGTYPDAIKMWGAENLYARGFIAPKVDSASEAHFIVRVTDKGTPALSRYRRVVVTIFPKG
ncbi:MAG: DUF1593 domain-containing protein [Sphingomonadales bacterium]|nr:MAG: DUF1593 domain-containing protein [Sphingomonadales bacterium]